LRLKEWQLLAIALAAVAVLLLIVVQTGGALQPAQTLQLTSAGYVALVRVEGTIAYSASQLTLLGATLDAGELAKLVEQVASDPAARAVVLLIDSPGGSAAASEELYLKVQELALKKPVVAYIREYGTSGAYMVALPARRIVASNSSLAGSVGVYLSVATYTGLLEKLGVKVHVFKSGELKDVGSPFRELTADDAQVLEEMVRESFELFKSRVLKHRAVRNPDLVFSGRPFTASQALELGLIDAIGTLDDAISLAREMGGLPPQAPIREVKPPRPGLLQLLLGGATQGRPVVPSLEILAMWPPPLVSP